MNNPIFSILIITLSLGFSFFYVKPGYEAVQQRRSDLATLAITLKSSDEIKGLVDQTEKTLSGLDAQELARFMVFLPETTDSLRLANNIQHIGTANGIRIGKIRVGDSTNMSISSNSAQATGLPGVVATLTSAASAQKYATTKTDFAFVATEEAFRAFLSDLEKSLGLVNVASLTLTPMADSGDTSKGKRIVAVSVPQFEFEMQVETYSLK